VKYAVSIRDSNGGAPPAASRVIATGPRVCVPAATSSTPGSYRIVGVTAEIGGAQAKQARIHLSGSRVVGLERDE